MQHPVRRRMLALVLSILLAGHAGPLVPAARASEPQPILVIPYVNLGDVPEGLGARTAELVVTELKSSESLKVVDVPGLSAARAEKAAAPSADPKAERDLEEARELVEQGKSDLGKGKFKQAGDALQKAVEKFKLRHAALGDFSELVNALVELAAVQYRLGLEEEGEAILGEVVRLDPGKTLDPQAYPPLFLRVFAGVQKKVLGRARGSLKIVSRPPGARVFIDGRDIGAAPIIVKDLVEGPHYVRLAKEGGKPFAEVSKVTASKVTEIDADLSAGSELAGPVGEVSSRLQKNSITKEVVKELKAACAQAGAKFAVFGAAYDDGPNFGVASYLFNASTGSVAQLQLLTFDPDLLGASIEVYKLGTEISDKIKAFPAALKLPTPLAMAVQAAEGSAKMAEVSAAVEAPVQPVAPPKERAPLKAADPAPEPPAPAKRAPVAAAPPTDPELPELPDLPSRPQTKRAPAVPIDEEPRKPVGGARFVARAAPVEEEEGGLAVVGGREEEEGAEEGRPARRRTITALEPEQIVIPKDEVKPREDEGLPWWVWGALGVVVAGAAGTGAYFLFEGGEPQSATATITWSP